MSNIWVVDKDNTKIVGPFSSDANASVALLATEEALKLSGGSLWLLDEADATSKEAAPVPALNLAEILVAAKVLDAAIPAMNFSDGDPSGLEKAIWGEDGQPASEIASQVIDVLTRLSEKCHYLVGDY